MSPKEIYFENAANTIIQNLKKRQMNGIYCKNRQEAKEAILKMIPENSTVSNGGSQTLEEIGILAAVKEGNYTYIDRKGGSTPEEKKEIKGKIATCDYFMLSANAITLDGEIFNIDDLGNRVAGLIYGPEHVIVAVGMNKVAADLESAHSRVRNIAAPPNTVRLKRNTPCAQKGKCCNCFAPDSICSQIVITRRSSIPERITVVLIGEELGF